MQSQIYRSDRRECRDSKTKEMSCHRIRGERSGINMILLGNGGGKIKNGINFSQRKYVIDLLTETSMLGCKQVIHLLNRKKDMKMLEIKWK